MNALMKLRKSLSMQAGDYEVLVILSSCLSVCEISENIQIKLLFLLVCEWMY